MSRASERIAQGSALAALAALAVALGVVPDLLSLAGTIALAALGAVALAVVALRRLATPAGGAEPGAAAAAEAPERAAGHSDLRLARLLFYAGCLLVAAPKFRFGGLTVAELLFIAAFAVCFLAFLCGRAIPRPSPPMLIAAGVFTFGGAVSSFDALSTPGSVFELGHAIYVLLLWPAVAAMVLQNRRQLATALTLWAVSAAIEGVAAVLQLSGPHILGLVRLSDRMSGFTPHPNDLGGATAIALVPALLLATRDVPGRAGLRRALRWCAVALIILAIALSGSITGMAAASVAVLIWLSWPAARTVSRVTVAATIICGLAVVALSHGVASPVHRLVQVASPTAQSGGSLTDRVSLAKQAWPRISRDPFVGAGLDIGDSALPIISHTYDTSYQLHGLPLAAWYQAGLFGMLGLLGLLVAVAAIAWRAIRSAANGADVMVGVALLAAFAAFVVETMSVPMVFQQYGWITPALIFAWSQIVGPRAAAVAEVSERAPAARGARPAAGVLVPPHQLA